VGSRSEREELVFRGAVPTLPAKDIERARRFYQEVVGCRVDEGEEDGSVKVHVGDSWIMVYPSEFAGTNQATAVGFGVEDVVAAVAELRERGVPFEDYDFGEAKTVNGILTMPNGQKGAWFKDPEGNIVGLFDGEI
jgi:catechol 2,3-dioxygenase-like lactoylglutathione lyase family enzyme